MKWEYLSYKQMMPTDLGNIVDDLDRLGKRGWEAFAVQENSISITFWLKRPDTKAMQPDPEPPQTGSEA